MFFVKFGFRNPFPLYSQLDFGNKKEDAEKSQKLNKFSSCNLLHNLDGNWVIKLLSN